MTSTPTISPDTSHPVGTPSASAAKVLFLGPDLVELESEIERLRESICAYSRTSLPSGPAADVLMAEFESVLDRLRYLFGLRRSGVVVPCPFDADVASVGVTVTYLTLGSAPSEPERVSLGSVLVSERLAAKGFVSYLSDLGLLLEGARPGDVRRGVVDGEEVAVRVIALETAIPLLV
jgi:transcription elongation GreA/GreB family factor